METLNKLTYDLLELRYKIPTDDNVATKRQMQSWIRQQRSIWVSNELNKNRFDPAYWQETSLVTLETHPIWGTDFKQSVSIIPPFIQVNQRPAVIKVNDGSPVGKEYPWIKYQDIKYVGTRKFDAKTTFAAFHDGYLILKRPLDDSAGEFNTISTANVIGIFEDPMDFLTFNRPDGSPVYHEDMAYPIHLKLYAYMREQILKVNFPVEVSSTQDQLNDAVSQD